MKNKTFVFNKNYDDTEQVRPFFNDFKKLHDEMNVNGGVVCNYQFNGKIKGITGDDEETAIYLLQKLNSKTERDKKIKKYLKDGYRDITNEKGQGIKKYNSIIQIGTDYSIDSVKDWGASKIVFDNESQKIRAIQLPRQKTRGYIVYPDVSILVK